MKTNFEICILIANKLIENGWVVSGIEGTNVFATKNYATIQVSFEMCSCHGGRLTICEKGHNYKYHRIEHEFYDEDLGITDPESELLWEIENEMMDVVNNFYSKMVYKVVIIGEYTEKEEKTNYFDNIDRAFDFLMCNNSEQFPNENVFSFVEGTVHYPNPVCHVRIKRIYPEEKYSWDKNKYWFEYESTRDDWKTSKTYRGYLSIFDKNK